MRSPGEKLGDDGGGDDEATWPRSPAETVITNTLLQARCCPIEVSLGSADRPVKTLPTRRL
jgi:hypothetical protein